MLWSDHINQGIVTEHHFGREIKTYENRPKNLNEMLSNSVGSVPKKDALICEDEKLTYAQFQEKVNALAGQLSLQWGIKKGDRVAVLFSNGIEYCISIFATCQIGAIAVTLNTRLKASELEFMLNDSGAKVILMGEKHWENVRDIMSNLTEVEHIFVNGEMPDSEKVMPFKDLLEVQTSENISTEINEDDPAFIVYTSGTTSTPKGAIVTHFNVIHSCISYQRVMGLTSDDRTLIAVPLFHITGMVAQLILFLYIGGTINIMKEYKTLPFIQQMAESKATHTIVVPTIYVLMLMNEELDNYDLSYWRIAAYGGAPISSETVGKLTKKFPGVKPYNCYGATETTSPATISPPDGCMRNPSSVGYPLPVADIKILDLINRAEIEVGNIGEICIKGPMVVPGYWNNPEANNKEFIDGFWFSGDIGKFDQEGFLYVMDRKKDIINRGGEKIFCVEVENVLYSHPKVVEASVVGVPDDIFGEQVKAVIVPMEGENIEPEEIQEFVKSKLAHHKAPKYVSFVSALPRNPGGKVLKKELKEL